MPYNEKAKPTDVAFGAVLRYYREMRGYSLDNLAAQTGMSKSGLSKIENDKQSITATQVRTLADCLNVPPGVFFESAVMVGDNAPPQLIDLSSHPDLAAIKRVRFKLNAGVQGFAIELDEEGSAPIFFRRDWMRSKGYTADKLLAIRIAGQSMDPTLFDGDLVVVNTADTAPKDGDVFAVSYEGELGVKRLKRDAGEWYLTSDNTDQRRYSPKRCNGDCQLIGCVVYRQTERI